MDHSHSHSHVAQSGDHEWRELAERITQEHDPARFMELVTELERVLGERESRTAVRR